MADNDNVLNDIARKTNDKKASTFFSRQAGSSSCCDSSCRWCRWLRRRILHRTSGATKTVTQTGGVTTITVTSGQTSSTGSTSSTSSDTTQTSSTSSTTGATSSTPNYVTYPAWVGIWPLDFSPPNPVSGLTGSCRSTQFDTITLQSNATVPGTRAYCTQQALMNTYPNVTWTNFDTGANGMPTLTALQAGQNNWDVTRGNAGANFPALGYCEPITDFYNSWEDKGYFTQAQMDVGKYQGDYYLLPDDADVHAGWWRMDLFAEAGYGKFDYKAFTYTGTTPNQMGYQELIQATAAITKAGASRNVYGTYWMNGSTAILGPWMCDEFLPRTAVSSTGETSTRAR